MTSDLKENKVESALENGKNKEVNIAVDKEEETQNKLKELEDIEENQNEIKVNYDKIPRKEGDTVSFFKQFLKLKVYTTALLSALALYSIYIIATLIILFFTENYYPYYKTIDTILMKYPIFYTIFVTFIRPILEEIIFRRLIFKCIDKRSKLTAYIVSNIIYGFYFFNFNVVNLWNFFEFFPFYFCIGLVLTYTYDYDGYILASILSNILYSCPYTIYCLFANKN